MVGMHSNNKNNKTLTTCSSRIRLFCKGSSTLSPLAVEMMNCISSIVLPGKTHFNLAQPERCSTFFILDEFWSAYICLGCSIRGAVLPDTLLLLSPLYSVRNLTLPVLISITATRVWLTAASGEAINANSYLKGTKMLLRQTRLPGYWYQFCVMASHSSGRGTARRGSLHEISRQALWLAFMAV